MSLSLRDSHLKVLNFNLGDYLMSKNNTVLKFIPKSKKRKYKELDDNPFRFITKKDLLTGLKNKPENKLGKK